MYDYRNEFRRVTVYVTEPQPGGMYPEGRVLISAPSFSGDIVQAQALIEDISRAISFAGSVSFE